MPPSAKRTQRAKRDTRKDAAATTSDALAESSPSRPAKRRKKVRQPSIHAYHNRVSSPG